MVWPCWPGPPACFCAASSAAAAGAAQPTGIAAWSQPKHEPEPNWDAQFRNELWERTRRLVAAVRSSHHDVQSKALVVR